MIWCCHLGQLTLACDGSYQSELLGVSHRNAQEGIDFYIVWSVWSPMMGGVLGSVHLFHLPLVLASDYLEAPMGGL